MTDFVHRIGCVASTFSTEIHDGSTVYTLLENG